MTKANQSRGNADMQVKRRRPRRWQAAEAGALLLGLLALAGCGRKSDPPKAQASQDGTTQTLLVKAADVVLTATQVLESGIPFTGELNPQEVTEITARFDGDLQEVRVKEGQRVRKGQSLAVYRPRDMRDASTAADAGLAAAKKLLDAGAAAPSDLEAAAAARAAAEAQVSAAEAAANHAQENSDRLVV